MPCRIILDTLYCTVNPIATINFSQPKFEILVDMVVMIPLMSDW